MTLNLLILKCFLSLVILTQSKCIGNYENNNLIRTTISSPKIISISDGDTYDILIDNKKIVIRMDAIDAPEKGMPYWKKSKQMLSNLIFGKEIKIKIVKMDNHGRYVGRTYAGTLDISAEMIKTGMAWHYKEYNKEDLLAQLEILARQNQIGLWADQKVFAPWEIRKLHRAGISTKDSFK